MAQSPDIQELIRLLFSSNAEQAIMAAATLRKRRPYTADQETKRRCSQFPHILAEDSARCAVCGAAMECPPDHVNRGIGWVSCPRGHDFDAWENNQWVHGKRRCKRCGYVEQCQHDEYGEASYEHEGGTGWYEKTCLRCGHTRTRSSAHDGVWSD